MVAHIGNTTQQNHKNITQHIAMFQFKEKAYPYS